VHGADRAGALADPGRRRRAHLPDHEHHLPSWQPLLDAIDEMATDWGLPRVPVIADLREEPRIDPVLPGLEERRISYVLQVAESRPAVTVQRDPRFPVPAGPVASHGQAAAVRDPAGLRPARWPEARLTGR
jgi:hypothetical protein